MIYSTGTPVVSAVITTVGANGTEPTTAEVKKGDSLTDLVLSAGRHEKTIATATVKGFFVAPAVIRHGECTTYDGIPTHLYDPDGDSHFGLAEERLRIDRILVSIPGETEDAPETTTVIRVADIKSMTVAAGTSEIGNSSPSSEETV